MAYLPQQTAIVRSAKQASCLSHDALDGKYPHLYENYYALYENYYAPYDNQEPLCEREEAVGVAEM